MAYYFRRQDKSVRKAVHRIAREQIDEAVSAIGELGQAKAVHEVRKRCKNLRALIRLVGPAFNDCQTENFALRDLARAISAARDAKVVRDTCDLLVRGCNGPGERRALLDMKRQLAERAALRVSPGEIADGLALAREQLHDARDRVGDWKLTEHGWHAIEGGLKRTYRHARNAAASAGSDPLPGNFHELRKQVKYHAGHCRLLVRISPGMMRSRRRTGERIAQDLGEHHDLEVLMQHLAAEPAEGAELAFSLARARQARLEARAMPLAARLLAQRPRALSRELHSLWVHWRKD